MQTLENILTTGGGDILFTSDINSGQRYVSMLQCDSAQSRDGEGNTNFYNT